MVIILQYIQIVKHYSVYLKLIECYIATIPQFFKKFPKKTDDKNLQYIKGKIHA